MQTAEKFYSMKMSVHCNEKLQKYTTNFFLIFFRMKLIHFFPVYFFVTFCSVTGMYCTVYKRNIAE